MEVGGLVTLSKLLQLNSLFLSRISLRSSIVSDAVLKCALTIRWNGPGILRDLEAKLFDTEVVNS